MNLYRIRNWDTLYENNRTRELKKLDWLPIPNKQDGDGYTLIMQHENGAAIFGAWIACAQIASRCDPRGTLLRDGKKPHDSSSLSRMSRIPESIIKSMLEFVSSEDINWLEIRDSETNREIPAGRCGIPATGCPEGKGREGNGILLGQPAVGPSDFDKFWNAYPKKKKKQDALKAWNTTSSKRPVIEKIISSITAQIGSFDWKKDGGQFIPHPATWLRSGSWDDVILVESQITPKRDQTFWMVGKPWTMTRAPVRSEFQSDESFEAHMAAYEIWKTKTNQNREKQAKIL